MKLHFVAQTRFAHETHIGENTHKFSLPLNQIVGGVYNITLVLFEKNEYGISNEIDVVQPAFSLEIKPNNEIIWSPTQWGRIKLVDLKNE